MKYAVTIFTVLMGLQAFAEVDMVFTSSSGRRINRLWLPCTLDLCMIDTAGGGTLVTVDGATAQYPSKRKAHIATMAGEAVCDIVDSGEFVLAEKTFANQEFTRCAEFPPNNSPMLGLNFFREQGFALTFSTEKFSWLSDAINQPAQLSRIDGWYAVPAKLGDLTVAAIVDTGAPLTLIDKTFAEAHPELIQSIDYGDEKGVLAVDIEVEGVALQERAVYVMDVKATFGPKAPDIFIGMNHLKDADWEFDFKKLEFSVRPIEKK